MDTLFFVDPSTHELTTSTAPNIDAPASRTVQIVATNVDPSTALAIDNGCVYWIDAHDEAVMMVHE